MCSHATRTQLYRNVLSSFMERNVASRHPGVTDLLVCNRSSCHHCDLRASLCCNLWSRTIFGVAQCQCAIVVPVCQLANFEAFDPLLHATSTATAHSLFPHATFDLRKVPKSRRKELILWGAMTKLCRPYCSCVGPNFRAHSTVCIFVLV